MAKEETVRAATGHTRAEWFVKLDKWGAPGRPYREIAEWLTDKNGVSKWWAQKIIVEYEQERGLRDPGVRKDGTFEVSASKTVSVPVDQLFDAFVDGRRRKRWLPESRLSLRDSQPGRSARFDWADGASRVSVSFIDKGSSKSSAVVAHDRLTNAKDAQATKDLWRKRLSDLKSLLES